VQIVHQVVPPDYLMTLLLPMEPDLSQTQDEFVSTVSHEFRTPLTSIQGFADTLLQYGDQLPEVEKRRFIAIIREQAGRLIRLVENVLDVSRMVHQPPELLLRGVPVQPVIDKVIRNIQAKVKAKHPDVTRYFDVMTMPDDLQVWADADRLEQILLNLVDNAVKYSPANAIVRFSAALHPDDPDKVILKVQDFGMGLAPDVIPVIFNRFYRVENPLTQQVEGTGLGLYITRSLVSALGGAISVESTLGKGSTFTVTLPAATPERQAQYQRHLYAEDRYHG